MPMRRNYQKISGTLLTTFQSKKRPNIHDSRARDHQLLRVLLEPSLVDLGFFFRVARDLYIARILQEGQHGPQDRGGPGHRRPPDPGQGCRAGVVRLSATGAEYPSGCPGLYNACVVGRVVHPTPIEPCTHKWPSGRGECGHLADATASCSKYGSVRGRGRILSFRIFIRTRSPLYFWPRSFSFPSYFGAAIALPRAYDPPVFGLLCLAGEPVRGRR
jgi:hypothetical protein